MGANFHEPPARPTAALYAETPQKKRTFFANRLDGLVVKQIFLGSYWEKDEGRSFDHEDERATFMVRRYKRGINLFRLLPDERKAETRVDRVSGRMDNSLAIEVLTAFAADLEDVLDPTAHLVPTPVWNALPRLATDRDEVYLNKDDAEDCRVLRRR